MRDKYGRIGLKWFKFKKSKDLLTEYLKASGIICKQKLGEFLDEKLKPAR